MSIAVTVKDAIRQSVGYLGSREAVESIQRDPYWPKWDSPWWHMTLLWELGEAGQIPSDVVVAMRDELGTHFLPFFPLREETLPPEIDGYRHIICHCAVGTMYQVMSACGVDVGSELPWMRPWIFRYQLPDGGLNCDEAAYTKATPKSSIVSTLPPLEAILFHTPREFTLEETEFLDRGAGYLIAHRLYRTLGGDVIDGDWLHLCFPRFYYYDVLRGLRVLARWAVVRGQALPGDLVEDAVAVIERSDAGAGIQTGRRPWVGRKTLEWRGGDEWEVGLPVSSFALLDSVGDPGTPSSQLTTEWKSVKDDLAKL
ncbi:MAG: hypothetical protein WBZ45_10730 [Acidimicrobiia bacterium]